ncbi:MAG: alpha/beta hydrolase [Bacteriovoracaceae bacterium]|nr:alpha/beta hydrolase [Bacteriovoracaceae bacterium]
MTKNNNFAKRKKQYFCTSDGIKIAYSTNFTKIRKTEPVFVFNYGLVCNNSHWKEQYNFFDKKGFQLLLHDYRCHHESTCCTKISHLTFENIANDINELVIHVGGSKIILFGHSMGVNVSLEFASKFPRKTKGLILLSGTIRSPQDIMFDTNIIRFVFPYIEWLRDKAPKLFNTIWKTCFINPLIIKTIHQSGFNKHRIPEEVIIHYLKNISKLPPQVFFQLFKEMNLHDIGKSLKKIKKPSLVVGGNNDKIIPPHLQRKLHKLLPNSEIYIIKNGSHMPHLDYPVPINKRILKFIEKNF